MAVAPARPGTSPDRPKILGRPNGDPPILVAATGMYLSLSKGQQCWVTGTAVAFGVEHGSLVVVQTRLPYTTPELIELDGPPPGFDAMLNPIASDEHEHDDHFVPAEVGVAAMTDDSAPTVDPETMSVREVLAYVADHPEEADRILALEQAGKQRASIVRALS